LTSRSVAVPSVSSAFSFYDATAFRTWFSFDDTVEIVDFKTDRSWHAETESRIQLSVYYHVLEE